MSLAKKFKTDTKAANDGVWFDYEGQPNDDKTVPGFKLARRTGQNKAFKRVMRDLTIDIATEGETGLGNMSEEEAQERDLALFCDTLLMDWRNFQPNDDGKVMEYSKENARKIFGNPDWVDLRKDLNAKCGQSHAYQYKKQEAEVKN